MSGNLRETEMFDDNSIEFDENIIRNIDDSAVCRNILKTAIDNDLFLDVTLIAGIDLIGISAHRMVLAGASEYFATMLTDSNEKQIQIENVAGDSLESLVNYCYTGKICIHSKNVLDLVATASMLEFEEIQIECKQFLDTQLKSEPKNCLKIYLIADKYSFIDLMLEAVRVICKYFNVITRTMTFYEMNFNAIERILRSDERFSATEQGIFEAAMKWIDFDKINREDFIPDILKLIRFTQIHPTYLFKHIRPLCESYDCMKLLTTALHWLTLPEPERIKLLSPSETVKRTGPLKMLVVGGNESDDVFNMESYCFESKKWIQSDLINLPCGIVSRRLLAIDENVYIIGSGYDQFTQPTVGIAYHFNLRTLKLSALVPMSIPRESHGLAIINKTLYLIGRHNDNAHLNSVECYDLRSNKWVNCKPMSLARARMGVAVLETDLYVIGGFNESISLDSVEQYSSSTDTWSFVQSMNRRRRDPGVGVLNGKIYVIGGYDEEYLDSVEFYDPDTKSWTMIAALLTARRAAAIAVYENEILAIGGIIDARKSSDVERYNEHEKKWIKHEPLEYPRSFSAVTMIWDD